MSRRSGNNYSGARYLFAQNQRRETQTTSGEGLTLMGSSQDRKVATQSIEFCGHGVPIHGSECDLCDAANAESDLWR